MQKKTISQKLGLDFSKSPIIPHGIERRFFLASRTARDPSEFTSENPARILYVSIVDMYKHQWNVIEAVGKLKQLGEFLELTLVGDSYPPAAERLEKSRNKVDPDHTFIKYFGKVPFEKLHEYYEKADLFVFASSCENLPNIMLEAMASGLPILSSNRGPMPELLQNNGGYFDPLDPMDLADKVFSALGSQVTRQDWSERAFAEAKKFSWENCAQATFAYLREFGEAN